MPRWEYLSPGSRLVLAARLSARFSAARSTPSSILSSRRCSLVAAGGRALRPRAARTVRPPRGDPTSFTGTHPGGAPTAKARGGARGEATLAEDAETTDADIFVGQSCATRAGEPASGGLDGGPPSRTQRITERSRRETQSRRAHRHRARATKKYQNSTIMECAYCIECFSLVFNNARPNHQPTARLGVFRFLRCRSSRLILHLTDHGRLGWGQSPQPPDPISRASPAHRNPGVHATVPHLRDVPRDPRALSTSAKARGHGHCDRVSRFLMRELRAGRRRRHPPRHHAEVTSTAAGRWI